MGLIATVTSFGIQSGTTDVLYAAWHWGDTYASSTEHFEYKWTYSTGDVNKTTKKTIWYEGSTGTTKNKNCTYTIPSNAKQVKFTMRPISKKHKVDKKDVSYWTASWSTVKTHNVQNPPAKPSAPDVSESDKYKLKATYSNITDATKVGFRVLNVKTRDIVASGASSVDNRHARWTFTMAPGVRYKVMGRSIKGSLMSEWSDYSSEVYSIPQAISKIKGIKSTAELTVQVTWDAAEGATSYELEYTTDTRYFGSGEEQVKKKTVTTTHADVFLDSGDNGKRWFFRVRAINDKGESAWTPTKNENECSIVLGEKPGVPTTWSSTTTAVVGETVNLYWVHNSQDGSSETSAEITMNIKIGNAHTTRTIEVPNTATGDEKDRTKVYPINTNEYPDGATIEWSVRTKGITNVYGEPSIVRRFDIYTAPSLSINIRDNTSSSIDTVTAFPFTIAASSSGGNNHRAIGYQISIISEETYETVNELGEFKMVSEGEEIYSEYIKTSPTTSLNNTSTTAVVHFNPSNIDLANNISYKVHVVVCMDSGLTAEATDEFNVAWGETFYDPNADIGVDLNDLTAYVRPYCKDDMGNLVSNVTLSLYRREYDGRFVELATGINNEDNTYITDPHPALDYARYRVVAVSNTTGAVSYYDIPGEQVGEPAIVLTWGEKWHKFDVTNDAPLDDPPWVGEMLRLPYNIEVSENTNPDVSLVEYIGRSNPVSYYGTQMGESGNWNTTIPKEDTDTLFSLRRLQKYMGDVYVREPSGVGYWANIKVSFSQKYSDLTIPVTITVTRVEGGV